MTTGAQESASEHAIAPSHEPLAILKRTCCDGRDTSGEFKETLMVRSVVTSDLRARLCVNERDLAAMWLLSNSSVDNKHIGADETPTSGGVRTHGHLFFKRSEGNVVAGINQV